MDAHPAAPPGLAVGAMAKYLFAACFQRPGRICGHAADCGAACDRSQGCSIGTPLAHIETGLHPTPGGVWRLREKLRSAAAAGVAAFDVKTKNSKRREFS